MKILYSLPHPADQLTSELAGHTVRARAILAALGSLGHEIVTVEAATNQTSKAAVSTYRGVVKKLLPRPLARNLRDRARVAYSRGYAEKVIAAVEKHHPDVILETHIAFSLAGKIASEKTGCPLVLDDVAPSWEEERHYGVGAKEVARRTHQEVTQQAALLVAVNETIRRFLIEDGLPDEKIVTISNGIDETLFQPGLDGKEIRTRYGIPPDAVVIVFVGSFQPYHRVEFLIEAFAQVKTAQPARLLLVGEGQQSAECKAIAERLGITDQITFTGRVQYHEVGLFIAASDLAIMPAANNYSNPMKVYEYLAMGKPVIAPDQETITQIVTHGKNSYLFEPDQTAALAAALTTMIENAALRQELGSQASLLASESTWKKRGEKLAAAMAAIVVPRR